MSVPGARHRGAPASEAKPAVSVLLAVHNGERYLEEAVRSVLTQTLRDIEVVAVDDCSTDRSPRILDRLAREDPRLRVVTARENLKLAGALNLGLRHVRAPLVARMDDDDVAHPERLAVEKRFLDTHPDIALVGSSIDWIDADGAFLRRSVRPRDSFAIRWLARFVINLSHPTFMFRARLPDGSAPRYDPQWKLAEDLDFVCRLLSVPAEAACLPEVLLSYRYHAKSVSRTRVGAQLAEARQICLDFQRRELPADVVAAMAPMRECFFDFAPPTPERIAGVFAGARRMLEHDIARHPDRAHWMRRQTAQLVAWCLQRSRADRPAIAAAFLRHGRGLIPALGMRALEVKRWLPPGLYTDPPVWRRLPG